MKKSKEKKPQRSAEEQRHDFQTRPDICAYMASLMPADAVFILEPTPGDRNLVDAINKEFKKRGEQHYVVMTPMDYFDQRDIILNRKFHCILMNPPFSHHTAILDLAPDDWKNTKGMKFGYKMTLELLQRTDHLIALLPWFTLADSDVRLRTLYAYGIKSITALPRAAFAYARVQTCIIEFSRGYSGPTEFKVFDMLGQTKHNAPKMDFLDMTTLDRVPDFGRMTNHCHPVKTPKDKSNGQE